MANQTQRLELATVNAELGSHILFRFANDAVGAALIPTDSGDIKNLKQVVVDIQADGAEKISFATTIYPTTAAGIAATTDGAIFLVKSSDPDEIYAVYSNTAGVAVDTGKRALSSQAIEDAMTASQASADNAATSAGDAQDSADAATARVAPLLGPFASAPTTRNDASALQEGDEYQNTVDHLRYNWTGAAWVALNSSAASLETRLADQTDPSKGLALVGMMGTDAATYLKQLRVPIERFGAVGDFNPSTLTGTNNNAAFAAAKASGLKIQLKAGANYMFSTGITVYDGMDWKGDDRDSCIISCKPTASGVIGISAPLTGPAINNVTLKGFSVARVGSFAEHGVLLDNINGLDAEIGVLGNGTALGGAFGMSAFYPRNRPSTNCKVRAKIDKGGNFGLQFGNVDGGIMKVDATDTMREVIGIEPYALGRFNFVQANVTADAITLTAHGLTTGYPLLYAPLGNSIIPALTRADYWFAVVIDANTIKLAATKAQALAGTTVALAAFTGTHCLLKCGIARNIRVEQSAITVGDVASFGTTTGLVDITAASGGYHEGISVGKVVVIERNPTSGNHGLFIGGAHNVTVSGFESIGCKLTAVMIDAATINAISDATGAIAPSPAITCRPVDVVVDAPQGREFIGVGVRVRNGTVIVRQPYMSSTVAGAIGLQMEANAEVIGSRITGGTADCINGTALSMSVYGNNRDVNAQNIRDRLIERVERQAIRKTASGASIAVATLSAQDGGTNLYAGQLCVMVRTSNFSSATVAMYTIDIVKANTAASAVLSTTHSLGPTAGAASTDPSFTFSMVGNMLTATPVGSTSTSTAWNFNISALGDLGLS